jgi:hypothetical protein
MLGQSVADSACRTYNPPGQYGVLRVLRGAPELRVVDIGHVEMRVACEDIDTLVRILLESHEAVIGATAAAHPFL